MYEMALGQVPFFEERVNKLIMKIINEEVNFNKKQFNQYSMEFMEVIKKLLEKDPAQRPSWGEIENYPFWGLNENNSNSIRNNSHYSLGNNENSNLGNISDLNDNKGLESNQHKSSSSLLNNNHANNNKNNINDKNKKINKFEINNENEYESNQINDVDNNDKEFNFNVGNNQNNYQNEEENNSYNNSKFKKLANNKNMNELSLSLLNIKKMGDKNEKRGVSNILNDMALSLAKPDELPQIYSIMIYNSDKNIKPIIGNKIIEPNRRITKYDEKLIPFRPIYKIEKIK